MRGNLEEAMFHRLSPTANRVLMALAVFTFACWSLAAAALLTWGPGRAVALKTVSRIAARIAERRAIHRVHPHITTISAVRLASSNGYDYGYDQADPGFSWSLDDGEGSVFTDARDGRRARSEGRGGQPTFWFREDGEEYVVTDPAIVAEVRRATQPVRELGRQMGVVGGEMGRHGAEMGRLGGRMGAMGARLAILEARMARRSASRAARADIEQSTREMRAELQRLQDELSTAQERHAGRQRELSRRMSELSAQHDAAYRKAKAEVREIARKAQRQGKAERPHANA